jgi:hypothetical protein
MEVGKNSVMYMGLVPGPNKADNICGKTKVMGSMERGCTVLAYGHKVTCAITGMILQGSKFNDILQVNSKYSKTPI